MRWLRSLLLPPCFLAMLLLLQVLCYPALFILHVVIFLSSLMITALLWMLVSVCWGVFGGIKRGVGRGVMKWAQVQSAMDALQKDMPMYAPFTPFDVGQDESSERATVNMALLALQHWRHLWQRDLISKDVLQDGMQDRAVALGSPSSKKATAERAKYPLPSQGGGGFQRPKKSLCP